MGLKREGECAQGGAGVEITAPAGEHFEVWAAAFEGGEELVFWGKGVGEVVLGAAKGPE